MIDSVTGILIVGIVIAVLFGAKKLPEFARNFGKATGEFHKGKIEAQKEIDAMKAPVNEVTNTVKDSLNEVHK